MLSTQVQPESVESPMVVNTQCQPAKITDVTKYSGVMIVDPSDEKKSSIHIPCCEVTAGARAEGSLGGGTGSCPPAAQG
ncbi:MAG: hypothetical protein ACR2JT_05390 [Nocardioidaceae bacterium]